MIAEKRIIASGMAIGLSLGILCGCGSVQKTVKTVIENVSQEETETESRELGEFESIDISMAVGGINLEQGDSWHLDISRTENCQITSDITAGTLKIGQEIQDDEGGSATITVTVPKDTSLKSASIGLDAGDFSVSKWSVKELTVKQATGDCRINSCDVENINVKCNVGDVIISGRGSLQDTACSLSTNVGAIIINDEEEESPYSKDGSAKSIAVEVSVGDITIE